MEQRQVDLRELQIGVVRQLRHHAVGVAERELDVVRRSLDVLGDDDVRPGFADAEHARQVELAADRDAAIGEVDVGHRGFTHADVNQGDDLLDLREQCGLERGGREPQARAVHRVAGRGGWIGDFDEVEAGLAGVREVLDGERGVLPGDLRGRGGLVRIGDVVGERLPGTLQALPERDQRRAIAHAEVLAAEGELARAEADGIALLGLGVQFAELVHDDRTLLAEAVTEIAGQRERQARVDERGHTDAADGVGHGSWGLRDFYEFDLRNVRAQHAGGLRPVAAKHDRVPALRRIAGGVVGALGEVVEQERHYAALLAVPERLQRDRACGGQPLRELERLSRGLGELGTLRGPVVILSLKLGNSRDSEKEMQRA